MVFTAIWFTYCDLVHNNCAYSPMNFTDLGHWACVYLSSVRSIMSELASNSLINAIEIRVHGKANHLSCLDLYHNYCFSFLKSHQI